jgi:hypothetical protein
VTDEEFDEHFCDLRPDPTEQLDNQDTDGALSQVLERQRFKGRVLAYEGGRSTRSLGSTFAKPSHPGTRRSGKPSSGHYSYTGLSTYLTSTQAFLLR